MRRVLGAPSVWTWRMWYITHYLVFFTELRHVRFSNFVELGVLINSSDAKMAIQGNGYGPRKQIWLFWRMRSWHINIVESTVSIDVKRPQLCISKLQASMTRNLVGWQLEPDKSKLRFVVISLHVHVFQLAIWHWRGTRTSSMLNGLFEMQNSMNKHKSSILEIKSYWEANYLQAAGVVRIDCIVSCSTKEEIHRVVLFAFGRDWLYLTESKLCLRCQRNWFIVRKLLGFFMITSS